MFWVEKNQKVNQRGGSTIRHSRVGTKFCFKMTLEFLDQVDRVFPNLINENYLCILHIQIILDCKFQLQQTILIFVTNFQKTVYFQLKTQKSEHHY